MRSRLWWIAAVQAGVEGLTTASSFRGPALRVRRQGSGHRMFRSVSGWITRAPHCGPSRGRRAPHGRAGPRGPPSERHGGADDLRQWQQALDSLDAGRDIAWCEGKRGPWLYVERDDDNDRCRVTIKDHSMSLTTVTLTVPLADAWFDDACRRLDLVWDARLRMAED
ncbi:DUF5959 family protein [Streptomyces collinus]|uniref:DUF5959 family protein n=1 Tax=Streptomyces collinus TaxID=42684 RepID=UPI0037D7EC13